MLEWYRPGFTLDALVVETAALVRRVLGRAPGDEATPLRRRRYRTLLREALAIDPFAAPLAELRRLAEERGGLAMEDAPPDDCLDLLLSLVIEQIGRAHV